MNEPFDDALASSLADDAARAAEEFCDYMAQHMATKSKMLAEAETAQAAMGFIRNSLYTDPYTAYSGVKAPKGSVPCKQCARRAIDNGDIGQIVVPEATVLAPQVLYHVADTYEYVAICDDCHTDWWGIDNADRPASAPPFAAIPSWG